MRMEEWVISVGDLAGDATSNPACRGRRGAVELCVFDDAAGERGLCASGECQTHPGARKLGFERTGEFRDEVGHTCELCFLTRARWSKSVVSGG